MTISKRFLIIVSSFFLLLFITNRVFFFHRCFLENIASTITYPVIWLSSSISKQAKKIVHKRKTYEALFDAHMQLKKEYEKMFTEVVALRETIRVNNLTEELESFRSRYNLENALLCKILVKNFSPDSHHFLINKGSRDNIQKDMVAIYKLQIIGKVTEIFPSYSKITLISDSSCKIAAFTNTTSAKGIATGTNTINSMKLLYVSQIDAISSDDLVFSSGQGLVFPEGFCLGRIAEHTFNKKDLYHDISITPIIDLQKINYCLLTDQSKINLF